MSIAEKLQTIAENEPKVYDAGYTKGVKEVKANIYSFNTQSQRMFTSAGFRKIADEWYTCRI